jgi:two-component system, chemotaxis family, CheB/CheR fusion protein
MSKDLALKELLQVLVEYRGFDFRGYKKTTLERRFRKRMFQLSIGSYGDYAEYVLNHPDEATELLNTILINVTEFFRDTPAWEILRNEVLPVKLKGLKSGESIRAWSAGCASGQEAYSIAIVLSEYFGPRIAEYDVKIYATDIDDDALTTARRGEYKAESLRRLRPEWRSKYFHGKGMQRVNREIRRLVIFGKSNLAQNAPISHVDLLLCRNVLIYFDSELQQQILARLHYALEPGGILFLGKSESQLTNFSQFRRLNARWRIFQRTTPASVADEKVDTHMDHHEDIGLSKEAGRELDALRTQHRYMLETLRLGVLVLGADDTIAQNNTAMLILHGLTPVDLASKRLQDTDLFTRMPDLALHLQSSRLNDETVRFQNRVRVGGNERLLAVTLRPILDDRRTRTGTLIYCEDVSVQEKLHTTIEELESTSEELQSANEELETTNEELQSANEELETTNEELQSTNEELETTNEELQSLNEELETTNQELEERSKDLDQASSLYAQTLEKIHLPVLLVNRERKIEFWNSMALRLFGFKNKPPIEFQLEQLPLTEALRNVIIRRSHAVFIQQKPIVARNINLPGKLYPSVDIHFSFVEREDQNSDVLIMFEARSAGTAPAKSTRSRKTKNSAMRSPRRVPKSSVRKGLRKKKR